uniref:AB hydrolase-1 domain-containing protein n=1 Tax=Ananas comosus var. bracteatus TaxID=296719 RepID=A0A6V7QW67_ANACO
MGSCLSVTVARDRCYTRAFRAAGLRATDVTLGDGATVHIWVPRLPDRSRPALVLLHGFGATATWQWAPYLGPSSAPGSTSTYGGFVGYRVAALYPGAVERVVLICAGVCLEERDLAAGLFVVSDVADAAGILLPQRPEKLRQLVRLTFCRPPRVMPTCFIRDYIQVMCRDYVKEKTELLHALIHDRKLPDLPRITQPTLIIWGEQDRVFPLELAHRLKRHLDENCQMVVIKNAGHAVNLEKPKEVCKHILAFFLDSGSQISTTGTWYNGLMFKNTFNEHVTDKHRSLR